jgi:hypothetical protein
MPSNDFESQQRDDHGQDTGNLEEPGKQIEVRQAVDLSDTSCEVGGSLLGNDVAEGADCPRTQVREKNDRVVRSGFEMTNRRGASRTAKGLGSHLVPF